MSQINTKKKKTFFFTNNLDPNICFHIIILKAITAAYTIHHKKVILNHTKWCSLKEFTPVAF